MYQHDVDQKLLKEKLDDTVESCVNYVGVEVNTASKQLLMYVSGLGPQLAEVVAGPLAAAVGGLAVTLGMVVLLRTGGTPVKLILLQ